MAKRNKAKPHLTLPCWTPVGDEYVADPLQLQAALDKSGCDEAQLRRRLGAAYPELAKALAGAALTQWTADIIDWAVRGNDKPIDLGHSSSNF